MQRNIEDKLLVFEAIAFEFVVGNYLYCDEKSCNR